MTDPTKTYDVAILGWWYGKNYGSILTYYGLNRAIDGLGKSVLMVHEPLGYNGFRVDWPDDMLSMEFARRVGYDYTEQIHFSDLPELNDSASTFVVGSDQLWNPLIGRVNDDLFLDFVAPTRNRVAYATSFGNRDTEKFTPRFVEKHAANLQQFKAISVREGYAIDTARDVFGAKASLVVDPVFLLPKEQYEDLASTATVSPEGDYLAVFFLDPTEAKRNVALALAEKLGLSQIIVIPNPDGGREQVEALFADEPRAHVLAEDRPENFLRTYRDSSYVVTDSFHGTAFATIFEKPFSSIYNDKRGADRFVNLLSSLGLADSRRIYESDTPSKLAANDNVSRKIDFTAARAYIESGRAASLEWLASALDPATEDSAGLGLPAWITETQAERAAVMAASTFTLTAPTFSSSSAAWKISRKSGVTRLRVARGGAVPGNAVWTDLPSTLPEGARVRMTIDWTPSGPAETVNFHLRDPDTGAFRVIGSAAIAEGATDARQDTVEFVVPVAGMSQFMLGALHFPGRGAGADIRSIDFETIDLGPLYATKKKEAPQHEPQKFTLVAPEFSSGDDRWKVSRGARSTTLRVARGGAVLGNLVWTDLPGPLVKGSSYSLKINWMPRTNSANINIHLRNSATGQFRIIDEIGIPAHAGGGRTDTAIFRVTDDGFDQIMFGAVHFTGRHAGADVHSITVHEFAANDAKSPQAPSSAAPNPKGFAGVAKTLALKDFERQHRSHVHSVSREAISGARARMIFHAHAVEKGLSRSNFRAGFGKIAVPGLAKEMNAWLAAGYSTDDTFLQSSAAVMKSYFARHEATRTDVTHFRELFSPAAMNLISSTTHAEGGVIPAADVREISTEEATETTFLDVVYGRRSVREFTSEKIADEDIDRAVRIAMQAPSVCNRQGARVHQFDDPDVIKAVLDIQGGFSGYDMPPRLLLVTADLDAFLFAAERNQPFVDGGLFMMSLLLGLTQVGLGSCSLNTAMGTQKETAIRKLIDIPDHEVFISFVAVGHYEKTVLVPRSKRTDINDVLVRHDKG